MVLKVKFVQNMAMLDMVNNSNLEPLILNPEEALEILDLRSLGYYKIKQGVIQQKLSRFYNFELAEEVCIAVFSPTSGVLCIFIKGCL